MVLACAKDVIFQLCDGVMALGLVSGGDDKAEGMRAWARKNEFVDQATANRKSKSTTVVSTPFLSMDRCANPLAPVTSM